MRKVKVLSLPETIKEKSTFRAKALCRTYPKIIEQLYGPSQTYPKIIEQLYPNYLTYTSCHGQESNVDCLLYIYFFRVLGGLLAAHLIIRDTHQPFGDMVPADYNDELLLMAHDLANRLLSAFENTSVGIPYPRVSELHLQILW